ncbi:hypothetical protein, partial [Bacillus mycoides]|uniref:hypothetical protein n=1 Tax=Bacillus mycoides TaxID=1405 RepID=UPI003A813B1B
LNLDTDNYYIGVTCQGKTVSVSVCERGTNKEIKEIYRNENITKNFVKGSDGLYYNIMWSMGDTIDEDGLGWTIENVRDFVLEFLVLGKVSERNEYERVFDDIRYCVK